MLNMAKSSACLWPEEENVQGEQTKSSYLHILNLNIHKFLCNLHSFIPVESGFLARKSVLSVIVEKQ